MNDQNPEFSRPAPMTTARPAPSVTPSAAPSKGQMTRVVSTAQPPDAQGWWWGTGRRKTAVSRARIKPGNGQIKVQIDRGTFKTIDEYFTEERDRQDVQAPLRVTQLLGRFDIIARLDGGGYMGQAQAMRLAVSRALKKYDPSLEGVLRDHGFLTRDAREVERKKPGQPGARRRFQFSKR
jgi:small subunit ribosomal protein S9